MASSAPLLGADPVGQETGVWDSGPSRHAAPPFANYQSSSLPTSWRPHEHPSSADAFAVPQSSASNSVSSTEAPLRLDGGRLMAYAAGVLQMGSLSFSYHYTLLVKLLTTAAALAVPVIYRSVLTTDSRDFVGPDYVPLIVFFLWLGYSASRLFVQAKRARQKAYQADADEDPFRPYTRPPFPFSPKALFTLFVGTPDIESPFYWHSNNGFQVTAIALSYAFLSVSVLLGPNAIQNCQCANDLVRLVSGNATVVGRYCRAEYDP